MFVNKVITILMILAFCFSGFAFAQLGKREGDIVKLPEVTTKGDMSVEEAIYKRRSIRSFSDSSLSRKELSQILWAASGATVDGITGPTRAYASAGALYPLDLYVIIGNIATLDPGIYSYNWKDHTLTLERKGDFRAALSRASRGQKMIEEAPFTIVVTAEVEKVRSRYGERGVNQYVFMDAGHLGQNVHLACESEGLGTCMVGAFTEKDVSKIISARGKVPVYIMPVGKPKS